MRARPVCFPSIRFLAKAWYRTEKHCLETIALSSSMGLGPRTGKADATP